MSSFQDSVLFFLTQACAALDLGCNIYGLSGLITDSDKNLCVKV